MKLHKSLNIVGRNLELAFSMALLKIYSVICFKNRVYLCLLLVSRKTRYIPISEWYVCCLMANTTTNVLSLLGNQSFKVCPICNRGRVGESICHIVKAPTDVPWKIKKLATDVAHKAVSSL